MKKIEITVQKPCHENWEAMQPIEEGRFCKICQEAVVDFSAMGESEIVHYFEKLKGKKVCGNFRYSQIEPTPKSSYLHRTYYKLNQIKIKPLRVTLLFLFSIMSFSARSQQRLVGSPLVVPLKKKSDTNKQGLQEKTKVTEKDTTEEQEFVIGKVLVSGTAKTQAKGRFKVKPNK